MSDPMLPIGPFRRWLEHRVARYGRGVVAARCGVDEKTLHRWRTEYDAISLYTVDDALTREGSTALWELTEMRDENSRRLSGPITAEMETYRRAAECEDIEEEAQLVLIDAFTVPEPEGDEWRAAA